MYETPFLLDVATGSFDEYVASLSKNARKGYSAVEKRNEDLEYAHIEYNPDLIESFMRLWGRQLVKRGNPIWAFSTGFLDHLNAKGKLLCFQASMKQTGESICVHFVEKHGDYIYCQAPMYDKEIYKDRHIPKYMNFHLIRYFMEHPTVNWVDFAGGWNQTWREKVKCRSMENPGWKWIFIPREVKDNPDQLLHFVSVIKVLNYSRQLLIYDRKYDDSAIVKFLKKKYLTWYWYYRNSRFKHLMAMIKYGDSRKI